MSCLNYSPKPENEKQRITLENVVDFLDRAIIPLSGFRRICGAYQLREQEGLPEHSKTLKAVIYTSIAIIEAGKLFLLGDILYSAYHHYR